MPQATDIALSYLASFASADADQVAAHVTDDFENNQMGVLGSCFTGKTLYRERLTGFLKKFRHLHYTPEDVITSDNKVAVSYRMTCDDEGCAVDIQGVMIITITGNLVSRRCDYWDGLSYLAQTGISLS